MGDGQRIAIGNMEELGYVSGIMREEGLAETTEIAVVHWCLSRALGIFLGRSLGGITGQFRGEFFGEGDTCWGIWGFNGGGGAGMGGRRWDVVEGDGTTLGGHKGPS